MPRHATPLRPDDGPLAVFALELRALRDSMGPIAPTPNEISSKQGIHRGTIYAALQGKRVPTRDVLAAMVASWGGDQAEWTAKRSSVENALAIARQHRERTRQASRSQRGAGVTWGELQQAGITWGKLAGQPEDNEAQRQRILAFHRDLSKSRDKTGLSLAEISRTASSLGEEVAKSTLHQLFRPDRRNLRIPRLSLVVAAVRALTDDNHDEVQKWTKRWEQLHHRPKSGRVDLHNTETGTRPADPSGRSAPY